MLFVTLGSRSWRSLEHTFSNAEVASVRADRAMAECRGRRRRRNWRPRNLHSISRGARCDLRHRANTNRNDPFGGELSRSRGRRSCAGFGATTWPGRSGGRQSHTRPHSRRDSSAGSGAGPVPDANRATDGTGRQPPRLSKGRRVATDIATQLRGRGYDHHLLDRLLMSNHAEIQGACDRRRLLFLVLSRLSNPLEPYVIAVEEDARRAASANWLWISASRVPGRARWSTQRVRLGRRTDGAAKRKRLGLAAAGVVAVAAAPMLVLAAALRA